MSTFQQRTETSLLRCRLLALAIAGAIAVAPLPSLADPLTLAVSDFTGLDVSSGIKVVVNPADSFSATANSSNADDVRDLKYAVSSGVLRLWYDWSIWRIFNFSARDVTVTVTMPEVDSLAVSAGGDAKVNGVPGDELRVDASGGAHALIDAASAKRYAIGVSGGATATLSGTCYSARLDASGGGTLDAGQLDCVDVVGSASGGGHLTISAGASVTADASGGAHIEIHGHPPQTKINSSGGGAVSFVN